MSARIGNYVMTFTGRQWWPHDPRPEDVHVGDLAALAQVNRFGGATSYTWPEWRVGQLAPYSVAQHSCLVYELVCEWLDAGIHGKLWDGSEYACRREPDHDGLCVDDRSYGKRQEHRMFKRAALLHDGHEVYPPGDMLSPVLRHPCPVTDAIKAMSRAAATAFRAAVKIPLEMPEIVKRADATVLATEKRDLHHGLDRGDNGRVLPPPRERRIEVWDAEHARDAFFRRLADVAPDLLAGSGLG